MKTIWTIAGLDPMSCSGLQQDQKAALAMNVHCCAIQTTITAQNNDSTSKLESLSFEQIIAQYEALKKQASPDAIKIGMISSVEAIRAVVRIVNESSVPVVYDPVFATSSGGIALDEEGIAQIKKELLPQVTLLTPNFPEAEKLLSYSLSDADSIRNAATDLRAMGCETVLLKGGHSEDQDDATDYFSDDNRNMWMTSPKLNGSFRGTGCYLSTSITCALAEGMTVREATVQGRIKLMEAMESAYPLGGQRVLQEKRNPRQTPWISYASPKTGDESFPTTGPEALGFYPVLPSLSWLQRLLPLGVSTAQLRIKNPNPDQLEDEIAESIKLARKYSCRLFINDFWELAIKHGAYGVHLGQEDLDEADIGKIRDAGLRLGISTHSLEELSRANQINPSYIALGPIFETTCKSMAFGPQGIEKVNDWVRMSKCPIVAIGGLKPEHVSDLKVAGADGIALISDVTESSRPENRAKQWLELVQS